MRGSHEIEVRIESIYFAATGVILIPFVVNLLYFSQSQSTEPAVDVIDPFFYLIFFQGRDGIPSRYKSGYNVYNGKNM